MFCSISVHVLKFNAVTTMHGHINSVLQHKFSNFFHLCHVDYQLPPQVTDHPVDQWKIVPGDIVSFGVTATGTAPLTYQWQKDGVDLTDGGRITGATTATLTITGVMESDEDGYRCVVTNIAGIVTSNTATLTVGEFSFMITSNSHSLIA